MARGEQRVSLRIVQLTHALQRLPASHAVAWTSDSLSTYLPYAHAWLDILIADLGGWVLTLDPDVHPYDAHLTGHNGSWRDARERRFDRELAPADWPSPADGARLPVWTPAGATTALTAWAQQHGRGDLRWRWQAPMMPQRAASQVPEEPLASPHLMLSETMVCDGALADRLLGDPEEAARHVRVWRRLADACGALVGGA